MCAGAARGYTGLGPWGWGCRGCSCLQPSGGRLQPGLQRGCGSSPLAGTRTAACDPGSAGSASCLLHQHAARLDISFPRGQREEGRAAGAPAEAGAGSVAARGASLRLAWPCLSCGRIPGQRSISPSEEAAQHPVGLSCLPAIPTPPASPGGLGAGAATLPLSSGLCMGHTRARTARAGAAAHGARAAPRRDASAGTGRQMP